jgi:hypothetical protein
VPANWQLLVDKTKIVLPRLKNQRHRDFGSEISAKVIPHLDRFEFTDKQVFY